MKLAEAMTPVSRTDRNESRTVEVRCKACGCIFSSTVPVRTPFSGEGWNIVKGIGALPRMGGCSLECRCHVESRDAAEPLFSMEFGPAGKGIR